jgi:sensor histidine kinase YesM
MMLAPKKKLVSVLYTAVTLALFGLVVFLLLRVRELYHEHLKLQRLQKYAEEVKLFS